MSEAHYTKMISMVEDYRIEIEKLDLKLSELEAFLREARDKRIAPISLDFGELPNFEWLAHDAEVMSGWIYSVLYPEP